MCVRPVFLVSEKGRYTVPCGSCPECLQLRRSDWTARTLLELKVSKEAVFMTFTFSPAGISLLTPKIDYDYYRSLDLICPKKRVYQNLLKRIRKRYQFRYFGSFEFGENTERPHFHFIFYFSDVVNVSDFSTYVQKCWPFGNVDVGNKVDQRTAHYLTKDLLKPERFNAYRIDYIRKMLPMYRRDAYRSFIISKRSYNVYSLRPAIGAQYLENEEFVEFCVRWFRDFHEYPPLYIDGNRFSMPRYFIKKLFPDLDRFSFMMAKRAERRVSDEIRRKRLGISSEYEEEQLRARAVYARLEHWLEQRKMQRHPDL